MSLETGTFSGSQKLPVSRSQTSASFSSCSRFQLIAETRSISLMASLTRTPLLHRNLGFRHYPWGATTTVNTTSCARVSHTRFLQQGCDCPPNQRPSRRDRRIHAVVPPTEEPVLSRIELAGGQPV